MKLLELTDEACRAIRAEAILPFRKTGHRLPNGNWAVPLDDDVVEAIGRAAPRVRNPANVIRPDDVWGFGPSPRPDALSNPSPVECEPVSVGRKASTHGGGILSAETGGGFAANRAYSRPAFAKNPAFGPLSYGKHPRFTVARRYYGFARVVGGARRNRTDDLFNAIEALSQLSYGPRSSCCFTRIPLG